MYIGQAFGDGSSNAWERTTNHEKLQMVYEDHAGEDWDIFVSPLILNKRNWSSDDHIDDTEDGPSFTGYYKNFAQMEGGVLKTSVDLIEHALISHFQPHYNKMLIEWNAKSPTGAMQKMRETGFRLANVHLDGWYGLARFYSRVQPEFLRSHFISRSTVNFDKEKHEVKTSGLEGWAYQSGHDMFSTLAESADIQLRIFGDEAPEVRRPPEFVLRDRPSKSHFFNVVDETSSVRREIEESRRSIAEEEVNPGIPESPTYDSAHGTISIARDLITGEDCSWKLHDETGVKSGLVLGNEGEGKTNTLSVIMYEALRSGKFFIIPSTCGDSREYGEIFNSLSPPDWIATNNEEALTNLFRVADIVDARNSVGGYEILGRRGPGILFCIDDADSVLNTDAGYRCAMKILSEGGSAGVGFIPVLRDIHSLARRAGLIERLMETTNKMTLMSDVGPYYLMDLQATYGKKRDSTYDDTNNDLAFILTSSKSRVCLGLLCKVASPNLSKQQAKQWAHEFLSSYGHGPIGWQDYKGYSRTFGALSATMWEVRKHPDAWTLVYLVSNHGIRQPIEQLESIQWSYRQIEQRFDVRLTPWTRGPGMEWDVTTLYANSTGKIELRNPNHKKTVDLIRHLY
ncbi:hypothetical protein GCM10027570_03390 [Streptomonospora sediminis]